ncbi:MAG: hypothetical protein OXU69_01520 [Gemmatimonadota bacterium]|nr:hypothetical protein [Gemmatimonadota bacterium]MDE2983356.1 hypothetical protein [Gemmatimonadota bacterium]
MSNRKPNRLSFPAQILATGIIVGALVWAARSASSEEDSRAFDEAAEQTRYQLEGAARGIGRVDDAEDEAGELEERP